MPKYTQARREMAVASPLGEDVLLLRRMSGTESLGRLPEYQLDLLSESADIVLDDLLGKTLTVRLQVEDGKPRHFNGYVTRFAMTGAAGDLFTYHATMHPWLWFLTQASDCRIFQGLSVPDILKKVFEGHSLSDFDFSGITGSYKPREYCVQYRETDFDYVSRLMEDEGIYYYFQHEQGRHILKLADSPGAHKPIAGTNVLRYIEGSGRAREEDTVFPWFLAKQVTTGGYALNDYNFETPKANLVVVNANAQPHERSDAQQYDYPGGFGTSGAGEPRARVRLEGVQADYEQAQSSTFARTVATGGLLKLKDHPRQDQNREYLVLSASYLLDSGDYGTDGDGGETPFTCTFVAMPSRQHFRAARTTQKSLVRGPQTATVVGKSGEEIWTDQYGRIKVQFHWERNGKRDETSSCWVRVSQAWAGKQWGTMFLPRMGHEVVVSFLEGDPDRPLVTGSVYNADNMPPYALPAERTRSTIKSRSSKQGSGENFNEIRFEDKKDSEEIYVHAEKDMNRVVENNDTLKVGFEKKDKGDQTISIHNDRTEDVGHDETINIGHDRTESVGNNETISITKNRTEDVGENETISIGKNREETVGENETISITKDRTQSIGKNHKVDIGENRTSSIGKDDKIQIGKKYYLEAGDEITLKTGSASLVMKKDGTIQIKGKDITIVGSGKVNVKASSDLVLKGSKIAEN